MTFANCPKCGSSDVTTAGVCANCGWIRFPQAMGAGESKEAIYNLVGEIEIKVTGKALLDDYKRLLFENNSLTARIAELEEAQRWIPVSERLPDGGHRAFYEVACIYQDFGELALFSKGRWVIYEGENVYDVTKRVKFWRKRQYLPDEVIAILSKGETNPEVTE